MRHSTEKFTSSFFFSRSFVWILPTSSCWNSYQEETKESPKRRRQVERIEDKIKSMSPPVPESFVIRPGPSIIKVTINAPPQRLQPTLQWLAEMTGVTMTNATLLQRPQRFLLSFLSMLSEHSVRLRSWNTRVVSEDQWPNALI